MTTHLTTPTPDPLAACITPVVTQTHWSSMRIQQAHGHPALGPTCTAYAETPTHVRTDLLF